MLSLDAVAIGLLWQLVFTTQFSHRMPAAYELGIIGISIWLVYTVDRLFDSKRLDLSKPHAMRHRFHFQHQKTLSLVWFVGLVADAYLIVKFADESQLRWGFAAVAIVLIYVIRVQTSTVPVAGPTASAMSIPKELQAGIVFAFGISLPSWAESNSAASLPLIASTLMAGLLFSSNCLAIACWERDWDSHQGFHSSLLRFPSADRWLPAILFVQIAIVMGLFLIGILPLLMACCLIASSLLLMSLLVFHRGRVSGLGRESTPSTIVQSLVTLADVALVIPPAGLIAFHVVAGAVA